MRKKSKANLKPTAGLPCQLNTDALLGGFCDAPHTVVAHDYALQAKAKCIKVNAIQVTYQSDVEIVMKDYYQTTCGWYSLVGYDGADIDTAILNMIYAPGYCDCP